MTLFSRKQKQPTLIVQAIEDAHAQLAALTADDPAYAATVKQLQELYKIKDPNVPDRTTLKDWIPVIASVGGVALIMVYEQRGHSFTSKAASFIRKP